MSAMNFSPSNPAIASALSSVYCPVTGRVAIGGVDGRVAVYRPTSSTPFWTALRKEWHPEEVYALAWSSDGQYLASAGMGQSIKIWDADGSLVQQWDAHRDTVIVDVSWSPDGLHLASVGSDGVVHVWAMETVPPVLVSTFTHGVYVASVAWSPDGRCLASGNTMGDIVLSDPWTGEKQHAYQGALSADNMELYEINALAWSPNGQYLAASQTCVGGDSGIIQVFSTRHPNKEASIVYNPLPPGGCGWLSRRLTWENEQTLLAADTDGCLHQLHLSPAFELASVQRHCAMAGEGICFFNDTVYITSSVAMPAQERP